MAQKAKRLAPTLETVRELFLKSGNLCAFPGCGKLMMSAESVFIGQLCHIEAAEEGGERFNPAMTNEARRSAANLMLMCYEHHQVTNDVNKYPVEVLRRFKADHEGRFSRADRAILEQLTDWTTVGQPTQVENLKRLNSVLGWNMSDEELLLCAADVNKHIENLRRVPLEVRRFLGAVASRIYKMRDTGVVQSITFSGKRILASDLRGALRIADSVIAERAAELDAYDLGSIDEIQFGDDRAQPAVRLGTLKSGWCIWLDIAEFCEKAPESMSVFTDDLDFSRFDQ